MLERLFASIISFYTTTFRKDIAAQPASIPPSKIKIEIAKPKGPIGIIALFSVIVITHLMAFLFTLQHRNAYGTQDEWLLQNLVLISISFLASISFYRFHAQRASTLVPIIIGCYAIISYSNGSYIYQDLFLVTSLGCIFGFFLPTHTSRILGGLLALMIVLIKSPKIFIGLFPAMDMVIIISTVVIYELFSIIFFSVMREYYTYALEQKEMNARLNNAVVQLTNANLGFQQQAVLMGEESAENERKRISRDIHDTIGYAMTNIIMMMEEADSLLDDDQIRVKQLIRTTQSQAQEGWNETRVALHALRTQANDDDNCIKAIQRLVKIFQQATGIRIKLELGNIPLRFPEEIEAVLYRFIQEGLTNSFRHGRANAIDISFWMTENSLLISLRDNGIGSSEYIEGIGLQGIRERLHPLGGTLLARNVIDGFELFVSIPYAPEIT